MKIRAASAEPTATTYPHGGIADRYPVEHNRAEPATAPPPTTHSSAKLAEGHPMNRPAPQFPEEKALASNPLEEQVLEDFYRPRTRRRAVAASDKPKPTHYKIVCISLYNEDIERLEGLVAELKRRGHTRANKSQLIRAALDQVDLSRIPKGY